MASVSCRRATIHGPCAFARWNASAPLKCLPNGSTLESARKPFHVVGHQLPVELNLGGLNLHGRLDRLDEIDDAHVVIDYKTGGSTAVSAWQVPRPRMPQLPFYALAMLQQKFNLAGISFAIVRHGSAGFKGYLREKDLLPCADPAKRSFDGLPFDEYAARWAEELERIANLVRRKAMPRSIRRFRREEVARLASTAI